MSVYYVYIIKCEDESLYTGITTDVARRMSEHLTQKAPGAKYTQAHKPVELVAAWRAPDRSIASKGEYHLKRLERNDKDRMVFYPSRISALFDGAEALEACTEEELAQFWQEAID